MLEPQMNADKRRLNCWAQAYLRLSAFVCGSFALIGYAQVNPRSSIYGRDTTQVYVRDSAIAVEKFALAERMEGLREWAKAATVYQEILSSYADRVVASRLDAEDHILQYTSVVTAVQERLSR